MKILAITPVSATFELEANLSPYFSPCKYTVYLNGKPVLEENKNVFSLFGLSGGEYLLEACGEKVKFTIYAPHVLCDVFMFGAKGDGTTDDTGAFQAALSCLGAGAVLKVPKGKYLLKPLFLKSGVTVYLEKGAVLLGSANRNDYPVLPALADGKENFGTWQGEEADCFASLFTAIGQGDINIVGEGVIDCNAQAGDWYINHRLKRTAWRPRGMFFNRCNNILVQGITVKNTPSWNIHPYFCKNVKLYNLTLENPVNMPTTDGIDPDCCENVEIVGVNISVGDDCIAIKAGTLDFAKKYNTPCKDVVIRNCLMKEGHGGVVFGSELSGGIENITVTRCVFDGTDRGLRIKTRRGRGRIGRCDNVVFSDIVMKHVKVPFVINMYYNMGDENGHTEYVWTTEKLPVDERTPEIGRFIFKNMECTGVEYSAGAFYGLPESPIKSVEFENVSFEYAENASEGFPDMREKNISVKKQGLDFHFVENVVLENINIKGQDGEKVLLESVKNYECNNK